MVSPNDQQTIILTILCLASLSLSKPVDDLLSGDSQVVSSDLKKVYAVAPFEDLQEAGTGHDYHKKTDDDDVGYYISKSTKGDDGYKHFDSYHKKGGDKYGYETHSAYGKAGGGGTGGSHHEAGSYDEKDGDGGASHYQEFNSDEDEAEESRPKKYKKQSKPDKYQGSATEGESFFTSYETGDGYYVGDDDDGQYHEEEGDSYDGYDGGSEYEGDDGGHSEGYDGDSEGYYTEGKVEKQVVPVAKVVKSGHPGGATSYYVRHY